MQQEPTTALYPAQALLDAAPRLLAPIIRKQVDEMQELAFVEFFGMEAGFRKTCTAALAERCVAAGESEV